MSYLPCHYLVIVVSPWSQSSKKICSTKLISLVELPLIHKLVCFLHNIHHTHGLYCIFHHKWDFSRTCSTLLIHAILDACHSARGPLISYYIVSNLCYCHSCIVPSHNVILTDNYVIYLPSYLCLCLVIKHPWRFSLAKN